jgi:hypothetical protein
LHTGAHTVESGFLLDHNVRTVSGNPCNSPMHVDSMTRRIIIPRTECHDDWVNIHGLTDLPGPCTEDAIIRYLKERFLRNHFQVGFSSQYLILIGYYQTTAGPVVIRTNPVGTQAEPGPDDALSGLVEEWVSSIDGQHTSHAVIISGGEGAGKTFTAELLMDYLMSMEGTKMSLTRDMAGGWVVMRSLGSAATAVNRRSSRLVIAYHQYLHGRVSYH